ncbi:MAG TPA: response regulator [Polyangiaceae bacterium]
MESAANHRIVLPPDLSRSSCGNGEALHDYANDAEVSSDSKASEVCAVLKSQVQPAADPWTNEAQPLLKLKVVVVEDDFDTLDLVVSILCGSGAQVASATNVRDALRIVESWQPDLLLSDIGLPDEDGLSLIRQLRAKGRTVCAVAVSAYASQQHVREALRAGFHAYIAKPFDATHLAEVVSEIFRTRSDRPRISTAAHATRDQ